MLVDQGIYTPLDVTLDSHGFGDTISLDAEICVQSGPSDQDLIRLGFSARQMSLLRMSPPDVRQEAHDIFLRMLMEDDPALEDIDELF